MKSDDTQNIAQTLAEVLPTPRVAHTQTARGEDNAIVHLAAPTNFTIHKIDNEPLLPNPRRAKASAVLSTPDAFLEYVARHKNESTLVWSDFDPVTYKLSFRAVIDEHAKDLPGWRGHTATFTPALSNEWKVWTGHDSNKEPFSQLEFALFLERQADDITEAEGYPTHAQMLEMAINFEARQDQAVKSAVRTQSGGVELTYISKDDAQTEQKMKVFDKFKIGIPVFRGAKDTDGKTIAFAIDARLRYRYQSSAVKFWYELVRADKTHEAAALDMIKRVKDGLGGVPMLMGTCS